MSFFEDVINTTKSAAATAGKKTDEAVKFTKLKIKESQTTSDIKAHFEKLGQMSYEMSKSDAPDSELFNAEIAEIDKLYDKLSEINLMIDDLRQEVTCTVCGAKTKSDNSFCPKCGAKLPVKPAAEAPAAEEAPAEPAKQDTPAALNEEKKDEADK